MQSAAQAPADLVRLIESAHDAESRRRAATALLARDAVAEVSLRSDLRTRLRVRFLAEPDLRVAALLRRIENRVRMRESSIADSGAASDSVLDEVGLETLREEVRRAALLHDRVRQGGDSFAARFDVVGLHRRGGMGVVLEAFRVEDGRHVAVKRLHDELAGRRDIVERFRREAAVLERLRHPRVVPILEWGGDGAELYLVLDWMPAGSLGERWAEASVRERTGWLADAAEGLAFAHAMGVVHRDVKPSNILIDAEGRARLTDFGLARSWGETSLERPGAILGTPPYMAPEQRLRPDEAAAAADVFALGVIISELTAEAAAPQEVRAVFERAVACDPAMRPSAVRVRDALLRWMGA